MAAINDLDVIWIDYTFNTVKEYKLAKALRGGFKEGVMIYIEEVGNSFKVHNLRESRGYINNARYNPRKNTSGVSYNGA